jgi:phosphoserine phosphatase RsbU/P
MKWVAYLNFKQKWKGILLIALALFYLGYFFYTISQLASKINGLNQVLYADYRENVFIVAILGFIFIYAVFSLLVILFNLPTSSVFEQKLEEVVNFQRLSQSIQTEQNEGRVYEILLETSVSTVFADAAWLEIEDATGERRLYTYRITEKEVREIIAYLETNKVKGVLEESTEKTRHLGRKMAQIKGSQFRSILAYPISIRQQQIGRVALLKEVSDGFNKDMARIISTFANQAGISIENFRLLAQALENERYKEQLKIAKTVQKALLPELLVKDPDFDIVAYSQAADEVGGDYYDSYRVGEKRIALIIGDVSGKGTSAAFQMSQMKGIFSSLCQLDVPTEEFLFRANNALSICLAKKTFITASYFLIDTEKRVVEFSRAGHCPTLFYEAKSQKAEYFKNKGMGMGIIRNETFKNYIASHSFKYAKNDVLVLYTDGITEAKNPKGEEFGYDRLLQAVETWAPHSPEIIQEKLMNQLYDFTETEVIDDDYTVLIVKFK